MATQTAQQSASNWSSSAKNAGKNLKVATVAPVTSLPKVNNLLPSVVANQVTSGNFGASNLNKGSANLTSNNISNNLNASSLSGGGTSYIAPTSSGTGTGTVGANAFMASGTTLAPASNLNQPTFPNQNTNPTQTELDVQNQELQKDKTMENFLSDMGLLQQKTADQQNLEAQQNLPQLNADKLDLIAKGQMQTAQYLAQYQDIQNKPIAMEFIAGQQGEVARRQGIDAMITNSLIQAKSGQIESAQATVDRALSLKYDPIEQRIDMQKFILEMNYKDLDRADKKLATERQAQLDQQKADLAYLRDFQTKALTNAMSNNAPASVYTNIANASDIGSIAKAGGKYIQDPTAALDKQLKQLQVQKAQQDLSGGGKLTKITLNGVDYMQDEKGNITTPKTPEIITTSDSVQKSLDNIKFLKDTATKASNLSNAAGVSGAKKFLGDMFVGDTQYRQLESLTNTLKTNVLTLMTDPSIKKFFGPQMSNADVELMTSAGTTLNPEKQSPEMLKSEVKRLQDLFNRMETSIKSQQEQKLNSFLDTVSSAVQTTNTSYVPAGIKL